MAAIYSHPTDRTFTTADMTAVSSTAWDAPPPPPKPKSDPFAWQQRLANVTRRSKHGCGWRPKKARNL